MRKFLIFIFFVVLFIALLYKSPFSALYNYNKAKSLYTAGQYEQSLPYFERSLFADPKGILARFFYVLALSKSKPEFSVQKKIYAISSSEFQDEASKYAKTQIMYIKHDLLTGLENNYIYNASMGNDILRWDINSFPLKVYIEQSNDIPNYYYEAIRSAMGQWVKKTNFVKFNEIKDIEKADIIIRFKDLLSTDCDNSNSCKYVVAYTDPDISKDKLLKKMSLTFYKTNPYKKNFSRREVFNTALHELGHTLGIMGHSDKPEDVMYSMKDSGNIYHSEDQTLSMRDVKTLVLLYRLEPSISNVKNLHNENFYYPPLVMGNEDVRLQNKLVELKKYIESYPNMAAGYINIASVYSDMGDSDAALANIHKAETLNLTDDEKYIINFNKAIIYYNKQEISRALEFAKSAQAIKDDNNVRELIEDIEKIIK